MKSVKGWRALVMLLSLTVVIAIFSILPSCSSTMEGVSVKANSMRRIDVIRFGM